MSGKFNIPTTIVVFGATGDLAQKKIIPALFNLYQQDLLPEKFFIIGSARSDMSDEAFRNYVSKVLHDFEGKPPHSKLLKDFLQMVSYFQAEFGNLDDYRRIAEALGRKDDFWQICANKLFYLAVPPKMYKGMLENLASSGLTEPCGPEEGWTRVLIEKPLGYDSQTAEEINELLGKLFKEEQIYRIDHYLAKEMVQNILTFRFANNLLEPSWNTKYIEKIEFRMLENFGVETRGSFYDALGALRDVGQNHLLQMIALTMMDSPTEMTAEAIRVQRKKLLDSLVVQSVEDIKRNSFRGQYEGYHEIEGVSEGSRRETFFRLKAFVNTTRWQGMPIYMESGKRVGQLRNEVVVTFKDTAPRIKGLEIEPVVHDRNAESNSGDTPQNVFRNKVQFCIEPSEKIDISFIAKTPGLEFSVTPNTLQYTLRDGKPKNRKAEEYERVLLDCIRGDQMLFVSTEEVDAMWRFIDPFVCAWEDNGTELHRYEPDKGDVLELARSTVDAGGSEGTRMDTKTAGFIGLGKMGGNAALNLLDQGWTVYGYNRSREVTERFAENGLSPAYTIDDLVAYLPKPRVIWMMVPSGAPVNQVLFGSDEIPSGDPESSQGTETSNASRGGLLSLLEPGDILIDAGNSRYLNTKKRAEVFKKKGVHFVDCGTSGGPGGARTGACLMVGGDKEVFTYLLPLFTALAIPGGVMHFPGFGAGHFVKMVHNGIEYGMMQAIAEGFEVMKQSDYNLDLAHIAEVYNRGSVIESRLIAWLLAGYEQYGQHLDAMSTTVHHSGEGQWTVDAAQEAGIPVPVIEAALQYRKDSPENPRYTGQVVNVLRKMFGGHENTGKK